MTVSTIENGVGAEIERIFIFGERGHNSGDLRGMHGGLYWG
jgi:hypothetical protein